MFCCYTHIYMIVPNYKYFILKYNGILKLSKFNGEVIKVKYIIFLLYVYVVFHSRFVGNFHYEKKSVGQNCFKYKTCMYFILLKKALSLGIDKKTNVINIF